MNQVKSHNRKSKSGKPVKVRSYSKAFRKSLSKGIKKKYDSKIGEVMHEFKAGALHSYGGKNKKGKTVTSRKQAIAIALNVARRRFNK